MEALFSPSHAWPHLRLLIINQCRFADPSQEIVVHGDNFPTLRALDLSHNNLDCRVHLDNAKSLESLSMAFNNLRQVPTVSSTSPSRLCSLYLQYNRLESLFGIEDFHHLVTLDVGYNVLICHEQSMAPLSGLTSLKAISFTGNPIAVCKEHRRKCLEWMNSALVSNGLVLDQAPVSLRESQWMGFKQMLTRRCADSRPSVHRTDHLTTVAEEKPSQQRVTRPREVEILEPEYERMVVASARSQVESTHK